MDKLTGTRYTYTKTRVAPLVPFIFLIPAVFVFGIIFLLNSRVLVSGEVPFNLSPKMIVVAAILALVGIYVGRDLWRTFLRTVSEEIWITDRDIVWIGKGRRVLRKAHHYDILRLQPERGHRDRAWFYRIETREGPITFTVGMEHADELIARIDAFLDRNGPVSPPSSTPNLLESGK